MTLPVEVDGRELWLSFVAVRSYTGVVYAFRDLTVERRLDEAKSDFIATRLARAADADDGRARRGEDAPARRHRRSRPSGGDSCSR